MLFYPYQDICRGKKGEIVLKKNFNVPNALSLSRIVFLPLLFALAILEMRLAFLILYILVGSTDAFDGFIARRFNQVTEFGKTIDSTADLLFYISTAWFLYRLYPEFLIPNMPLLIAFFSLLAISFLVSFAFCGKPIMMHTFLLRFNAVAIYVLIVLSYFTNTTYLVTFILIVYLIGFTEEILIFIKYGEVDRDTNSIICLIRDKEDDKEEMA